MLLSIVTTLYRSAPYLEEFYRRAIAATEEITNDFELVLVNDGSPDDAMRIALSLLEKDARVSVVDLSRNFGHHKAMMTGLSHSRGDLVFLVDCDLEEEPELLTTFRRVMEETRADVVYGVQPTRKGGFLERLGGRLFYGVFNILSSYPVPSNVLTARLMTRRYVEALVAHRDREVFLLGLWAITGFHQVPVVAVKHTRGSTSYTLRRRISVLVNAVTSFSNRPLVFVFYLGCFISAVASAAAAYLIVRRLFFGTLLSGWPSLIVSIWMLGGLTIFCIGIVGIYVSKIFTETKQRPYTVIRHVYGPDKEK